MGSYKSVEPVSLCYPEFLGFHRIKFDIQSDLFISEYQGRVLHGLVIA